MLRSFVPAVFSLLAGITCLYFTSTFALDSVVFAQSSDPSIIRIVSSLPRTGSSNAQTNSMVNGIKLALEEAKYQIGSYKLVYEDWDDASPERGSWDPAVEAANADKAIADTDIMAYIGTYNSGAAKISMPKLNMAGLAMVSPANTWPGLTKAGFGEASEPHVYRPSGKVTYFRVSPTDDLQGPAGARWAQSMGVSKVFLMHDRELYGLGVATLFRKAAEGLGLKIVGFEGIDGKAANYRSLAIKVRQTGAEMVYFGGTTQTNAGQIIKDIRAVGLKDLKYMVPDGCFERAFINAAGAENLNGRAFVTFGGLPADQLEGRGRVFRENYLKRYGLEPESYAVYGYESASVVIDAIRRAGLKGPGGKDRSAIVSALRETRDFQGALGSWSFNADGDITQSIISGNAIENGEFKFVKAL